MSERGVETEGSEFPCFFHGDRTKARALQLTGSAQKWLTSLASAARELGEEHRADRVVGVVECEEGCCGTDTLHASREVLDVDVVSRGELVYFRV